MPYSDIDLDDQFLLLNNIREPDSRSAYFIGWQSLEERWEIASQIRLEGYVPKHIRVQFETVRNLYLYAWFVYRLRPVVEQQAYSCLELALREYLEGGYEVYRSKYSGQKPAFGWVAA